MSSEHIWEEDTFLEIKEKLVEENRKYWLNKKTVKEGAKWIFVYHGMSGNHFYWAVRENILAKGLQERTNLPIASVIDGFGRAIPEGFDESFGIVNTTHLLYREYVDESSKKTICKIAQKLAEETYQDRDQLLRLEYRGIQFGNELYDHLLLKNVEHGSLSFECFDLSLERYAHYIRGALSLIDHAFRIFSQRCPEYVITTENLQLKCLFGKVARTFGAKEIEAIPSWPEKLVQFSLDVSDKKLSTSDWMGAVIKKYVQPKKIKLKNDEDLFVIERKAELGGDDLLSQLGISNRKKNVFILPHALVDVPREASRMDVYYDYTDWFIETLEFIRNIQNVNWIIKDHPLTAYYRQSDYIKGVFRKSQTPNMYWCDANVSGLLIKKYADCVVTCSGDAALEYWACGIPTITASETFFTDLGISYNMKSRQAYKTALENIPEIAKPTEESSKRAREILAAYKWLSNCETQDELVNLFMLTRKAQLDSYLSGLNFHYIPEFCEEYMRILKQGFIEKSCIYQMQNVFEVP